MASCPCWLPMGLLGFWEFSLHLAARGLYCTWLHRDGVSLEDQLLIISNKRFTISLECVIGLASAISVAAHCYTLCGHCLTSAVSPLLTWGCYQPNVEADQPDRKMCPENHVVRTLYFFFLFFFFNSPGALFIYFKTWFCCCRCCLFVFGKQMISTKRIDRAQ